VFYDVVVAAAADLTANFTNDLATLIAAKGGIAATANPAVTVYAHRSSDIFVPVADNQQGAAGLPGVGVFCVHAKTQAKRQGARDNVVTCFFDYFARGADPAVLTAQMELAAEALLRAVDRLSVPGSDQLWGAGEEEQSVDVAIQGTAQVEGSDFYEDRVLVSFPVEHRDLGL